MIRFAALYEALDRTTSTNAKVAAIVEYMRTAPPGDAAWALYFLTGRRLTRLLPAGLLHAWTVELTRLPEWLIEESYHAVGDFAEAISLLLAGRLSPAVPEDVRRSAPLHPAASSSLQGRLFEDAPAPPFDADVEGVSLQAWIEERILPLRVLDDEERRVRVIAWWSRLGALPLLVLNKLLTGELRVGVSRTLVVRAISDLAGVPRPVIEHRLMGAWKPSAGSFAALVSGDTSRDEPSQPYPFCLASPLAAEPATLGPREEWLAEWKWDGIRAQIIRRGEQVFLWSRGEELLTTRFPEIARAAMALPAGTVLDGEVLAYENGVPRPFADLQRRIGRERNVHEVAVNVPAAFLAFDVLEDGGADVRAFPLSRRRARLVELLGALTLPVAPGSAVAHPVQLSEAIRAPTWESLAGARSRSRGLHVEGLMLKRWSSPYQPGRRRGDWWKWKIEPFTVDAVLIYAQPGSGRRATLFTDYTFGVWDSGELVPVAKAYSGLTDAEIDELDRWVRRHTTERFGPVSAVEAAHVFELGFERIARSTRHRSGVALRFPRMLRWRRDKTPEQADTLATLRTLLDDEERRQGSTGPKGQH